MQNYSYLPPDIRTGEQRKAHTATDRRGDHRTHERLSIVEAQQEETRSTLHEIKTAVQEISSAVVAIALHNEKIDRIQESLQETREGHDECDKRLRTIETAMPGLLETRNFLMKAVVSVVGLVGAAVLMLVVNLR